MDGCGLGLGGELGLGGGSGDELDERVVFWFDATNVGAAEGGEPVGLAASDWVVEFGQRTRRELGPQPGSPEMLT